MSSFDNLLSSDERKFTARIQSTYVEGEIRVYNERVFLLQNRKSGSKPDDHNLRGYSYSWVVGDGSPDRLSLNEVREFSFTDSWSLNLLDKEDYEFSATIGSDKVSGVIHVCEGTVYLAQNHLAGSSPSDGNTKGCKYTWSVHSGSSDDLRRESVTDFILKGRRTMSTTSDRPKPKFSLGDRVITKPGLIKFAYGDRTITSIVRIPGTVVRESEYKPEHKSFSICVRFDNHSDTWYILEKELDKYHDSAEPSPPTPKSCRFKPGDRVKVITTKPYVFGGSFRGNATVKEAKRWYSEGYTCVRIEFDDGGPDYDMADYELDFIKEPTLRYIDPFSPTFDHSYVERGPRPSDYEYDGDEDDDDKHKPLEFKTVKRFSL